MEKISNAQSPKKFNKKILIFLLVGLIIEVVSAWLVYLWQHDLYEKQSLAVAKSNKKLLLSDKKVASSNKQIEELKTQVLVLEKKYEQLNDKDNSKPVVTVEQAGLGVVVNGAIRFTPCNCMEKAVGVNVTLTNNATSSQTIDKYTFKLLDAQNNSYLDSGLGNTSLEQQYLPSDYVLLPDQQLAPKQTVRGTVIFIVSDETLSKFTLVSGTKTYPVAIN